VTDVLDEREVRAAFARFIEGREVARVQLVLVVGERDWTPEFTQALAASDYVPLTVGDAEVEPGKVKLDADLLEWSARGIELYAKVGERLGERA